MITTSRRSATSPAPKKNGAVPVPALPAASVRPAAVTVYACRSANGTANVSTTPTASPPSASTSTATGAPTPPSTAYAALPAEAVVTGSVKASRSVVDDSATALWTPGATVSGVNVSVAEVLGVVLPTRSRRPLAVTVAVPAASGAESASVTVSAASV